jgi:hypothetical protein
MERSSLIATLASVALVLLGGGIFAGASAGSIALGRQVDLDFQDERKIDRILRDELRARKPESCVTHPAFLACSGTYPVSVPAKEHVELRDRLGPTGADTEVGMDLDARAPK